MTEKNKIEVSRIQEWDFYNNMVEFRECNHTVYIIARKDVLRLLDKFHDSLENLGKYDFDKGIFVINIKDLEEAFASVRGKVK